MARTPRRRHCLPALAAAATLALSAPPPAHAAGPPTLEPIGQELFATGTRFHGTEVGGLSGLVRDPRTGRYLAISDDRSDIDPARFYTLDIDLSDGRLDEGDVRFRDVTTLRRADGSAYPTGSIDAEGIARVPGGRLVVTSEGDAAALVPPFVGIFRRDGRRVGALPLPRYYRPDAAGTRGVRDNLAFESAGTSPDGRWLFTATENALAQDGPAAAVGVGSRSRLLRYDLRTNRLDRTVVYPVEPVAAPPVPAGAFATSGLADVLPLGRTRLLTLERSFSTGVGVSIRIFVTDLRGATDVTGTPSLAGAAGGVVPARKHLLLDLTTLGILLDNVEGIAWGPLLPDGRRSVVLVSDNNFSGVQLTQFLAFALSGT